MDIVIRAWSFPVPLDRHPRRGSAMLAKLSTFELLLYVTMGDLVQQGVTQQDYVGDRRR